MDEKTIRDLTRGPVPGPSAEQTNKLINESSTARSYMGLVADSSERLERLSETLIKETANVKQEVALLSSSSERLERLTVTLKNLTLVLICLTILAAIVPIGVEVWKAYHPTEIQAVKVADPPATAPPTPPLPPH